MAGEESTILLLLLFLLSFLPSFFLDLIIRFFVDLADWVGG